MEILGFSYYYYFMLYNLVQFFLSLTDEKVSMASIDSDFQLK